MSQLISNADDYETRNDVTYAIDRTPTYNINTNYDASRRLPSQTQPLVRQRYFDEIYRQIPFRITVLKRDNVAVVEPFEDCDDRTCSVCLDEKEHDQFAKLNCNHVFCDECVSKVVLFSCQMCCPLCRATIDRVAVQTEAQMPLFNKVFHIDVNKDFDLQDDFIPIPPMDLQESPMPL